MVDTTHSSRVLHLLMKLLMIRILARVPLVLLILGLRNPLLLCQEVKSFEVWSKEERQKFGEFKDDRDRDFSNFLKQQWREARAHYEVTQLDKPKPKRIPVWEAKASGITVGLAPKAEFRETRSEPRAMERLERLEDSLTSGHTTPSEIFPVDKDTLEALFSEFSPPELRDPFTSQSLGAYWSTICRLPYERFVAWAVNARTKLDLNDWGYVLFVSNAGRHFFRGSLNSSKAFTWFVLTKSGFDAKIGYDDIGVYLLLPAQGNLFQIPYFVLGVPQKPYYTPRLYADDSTPKGSLRTYEGHYRGAGRDVDFSIKTSPRLGREIMTRHLRFTYDTTRYEIEITCNKNLVDFYATYPQVDLRTYFFAPASDELRKTLSAQLRPLLRGKSELESAEILLRFVQTAFEYKTDQDQFGIEKPLFPDETIRYPYSDCDDRAILFSYLIRSLMSLEVVGLCYPGHMATAVKFRDEILGDTIVFNGGKYVVCDPTYMNAPVGTSMSVFKHVNPTIVPLN